MTDTTKFSDNDWVAFTTWIKDLLQNEVVTVTFEKKDGTERVMKCTLNPTMLPARPLLEDKQPKKSNADVMAVYDLENNGWRSFTIRSVKRVQFNLG